MTATATYLKNAAEIYTTAGPTGDFAEVVRGEVTDYGGNVLFSGTAGECIQYAHGLRVPYRLVPTEWRRVAGEVAGATNTWGCVIE